MSTADLVQTVARLEAKIARLEAVEGVRAAFNKYLYSLDTGNGPSILDSYTEAATLEVVNFPPKGNDMHFEGRAEIAPLYANYGKPAGERIISGGHNSTNVSIKVADDARSAKLSAYFTTTTKVGVQGGRYEGVAVLCFDGLWRFSQLSIISAWGWQADVRTITESVDEARSMFGGGPATGWL